MLYDIKIFFIGTGKAEKVKFTKNVEDSAIGSSCGPTATSTTENGGSPIKSQYSNPQYTITHEEVSRVNDNEKPSSDSKLEKISEKSGGTSNIDSACYLDGREALSTLENFKDSPNFQKTDADASCIYQVIPNLGFSDADKNEKKIDFDDQILNSKKSKINDKWLQVPIGGLLPPQSSSLRYGTDMSEEFASSKSDLPSEKRVKRKTLLRRESRFHSIKIRPLESGKMTAKDKKLLKMILVIFSSFLICYLPITITKTFKDIIDWRGLNIAGYILIYLTTCINPVIYVVMSSEYRSAYKNILLCRSESSNAKKK